MTHQQYVDYFKELAQQHYVLLHDDETKKSFYRANVDELISGLKDTTLSFPCLVLDEQGGQINGQGGFFDNQWDNTTVAFTILSKVLQSDFDDENEKLDEAKQIGMDIVARIYKDFKTKATRADTSVKVYYFNPNTVKYYKVGPLADQEFGYRFEFLMGEPMQVGFGYDADKWIV